MKPTKLSAFRPPATLRVASCDIRPKVVEAASSRVAVPDHKENTRFHSVAELGDHQEIVDPESGKKLTGLQLDSPTL